MRGAPNNYNLYNVHGKLPKADWRDAGRGECVYFTAEVTSASNQGGFLAFSLAKCLNSSDGFNCLIMTKPREARQSWPEIGTIHDKTSFVEGGEVWHAVRLPQNTKSSLVLQRVALEGITQTKVNSLNDQTSRISVILLSFCCSLPAFFFRLC